MAISPRASVAQLRLIFTTTLGDDDITAFLTTAAAVMNEVFQPEDQLSDELLTEIEKWLAAHFIACTRVQQLQSSKAGTVEAVFQGRTGFGLRSTYYGQTVLRLDTTGKLVRLENQSSPFNALKKATITLIGAGT